MFPAACLPSAASPFPPYFAPEPPPRRWGSSTGKRKLNWRTKASNQLTSNGFLWFEMKINSNWWIQCNKCICSRVNHDRRISPGSLNSFTSSARDGRFKLLPLQWDTFRVHQPHGFQWRSLINPGEALIKENSKWWKHKAILRPSVTVQGWRVQLTRQSLP